MRVLILNRKSNLIIGVIICSVTIIMLAGCYSKSNSNPQEIYLEKERDDLDTSLLTESRSVSNQGHLTNFTDIGHDSNEEFYSEYQLEYYGVPIFLSNIIDRDEMIIWFQQFEGIENQGGRSKWELNIANAIHELNIPKEDFISANQGLMFSEYQIEALYSGNQSHVNEAFVNEYALLTNEKIYSLEWLTTHAVHDYEAEGITAAILEVYLQKINIADLIREHEQIQNILNEMKDRN